METTFFLKLNFYKSAFDNLKMKKFYYIVALCIFPFIISAQKYDNVWLFGYGSNDINLNYGGTLLEFEADSINTFYEYRNMDFNFTNTSMCDTMGSLLFYSNGASIWNQLNEVMENGEGLNPGPLTDNQRATGLIIVQGVLPIKKFTSDSLYYLIHSDIWLPEGNVSVHGKYLYYSLIDMSKNNGLGEVVEKNQIIIEGVLALGKIAACQHANGEDWWLFTKKYDSDIFYQILLSENGFQIEEQSIGEITHSTSLGQAAFSPDGTKYVRQQIVSMELGNFLNIYDFDRCTGELSNPIQITYADSAWSGGVAISPNSRFLYVSSYEYVYQFDLWADDIESTKDTVAIYDGWYYGNDPNFRSTFFLMQLGPDGKIYISANNSIPNLHVINYPDLPGDSCEVCQHCIELPTFNAFSMPNFPNYRLGAAAEPCITDAVDEPEKPDIEVTIYPNPASGVVWVQVEDIVGKGGIFVLYNALGKEVKQVSLSKGETEVSLGGVGKGLYFYEVKKGVEVLGSGKLVVLE